MGDSIKRDLPNDGRILAVVGALRRAIDRESCLDILVGALSDLPGVLSVHVSVLSAPDSTVTTRALSEGEQDELAAAGTLVVSQRGQVPSNWPMTTHAWRPAGADRALHRALATGRIWEGVIGAHADPYPDGHGGRRLAAAFPVPGEHGTIAQALITSGERLSEDLLTEAYVLACAAGPVLASTPATGLSSGPSHDVVAAIARTLTEAEPPFSLVSVTLPDTSAAGDRAPSGHGSPEAVGVADLRAMLVGHDAWNDHVVLRGEGDELIVVSWGAPREDVVIATSDLRDQVRRTFQGATVLWGSTTIPEYLAEGLDPRITAEALLTLARASRDADSGAKSRGSGLSAAAADTVVRLVGEVLEDLDEMLDASIPARLAHVASRCAVALRVAAWQVRGVDADTGATGQLVVLREPDAGARRAPLFGSIDRAVLRRPEMRRAAEGSAFSATLASGEPSERVALAVGGYASAVAAGGYDPDARRWLVELYGDSATHELDGFAPTLLALVQAGLGFPRDVAVMPV